MVHKISTLVHHDAQRLKKKHSTLYLLIQIAYFDNTIWFILWIVCPTIAAGIIEFIMKHFCVRSDEIDKSLNFKTGYTFGEYLKFQRKLQNRRKMLLKFKIWKKFKSIEITSLSPSNVNQSSDVVFPK